jgi:subtilase family serine protease
MIRARRAHRPSLDRLDERCLPTTGLTPAQVVHAYGLDAFHLVNSSNQQVKPDGSGQTIAIVDAYHDPYLASDVQTFDRQWGLPTARVTQYSVAGTPTNDGWAGEEMLDVEWAHALAPGAKIDVVEAASDSFGDLLNAVNYAKSLPGVSTVSMSWGGGEFSGETSYDSVFTTPSGHRGVTFLAATGDQGAWNGADWPASSPNVVAVGGTSLNLKDSSGTYGSETGWSGSGGGYSSLESEPAYQQSVQTSGARTTPDIAMDADPNTGVYVYYTTPSTGTGGWALIGGTSASTPMWASVIAIADQGRALAGQATLDGATQTLPALYSMPASDFHDITSGSNGYSAHAGYDLVTGRGSPSGYAVVRDLMAANGTSASTTSGSTSGGSTGSFITPHLESLGGNIRSAPASISISTRTSTTATAALTTPTLLVIVPVADPTGSGSLLSPSPISKNLKGHDAALALLLGDLGSV